jgi:hypothetical protein
MSSIDDYAYINARMKDLKAEKEAQENAEQNALDEIRKAAEQLKIDARNAIYRMYGVLTDDDESGGGC